MTELTWQEARHELKFVCDLENQHRVERWLVLHPAGLREVYPARRINSLYLDSRDLQAYHDNLSGVSERSKLRLRWYGETLAPDKARFEVKLKRNRLGWKLGEDIDELPDFRTHGWRHILNTVEDQLVPGMRMRLIGRDMPVLICGYWRRYLASADGRVRVTVDRSHFACDQRTADRPNLYGEGLVPSPLVIEIKLATADRGLASWVAQGIPARLARHSKYMVSLASLALA